MKTLRKGLREFRYGLTEFALIGKEVGFFRVMLLGGIIGVVIAFLFFRKEMLISPLEFMIEQIIFMFCVVSIVAVLVNLRMLWSIRRLRKIFPVDVSLYGWKVIFGWNRKTHEDYNQEIHEAVMGALKDLARTVIEHVETADSIESKYTKRLLQKNIKRTFWIPWTVARECGIDVHKRIKAHAEDPLWGRG